MEYSIPTVMATPVPTLPTTPTMSGSPSARRSNGRPVGLVTLVADDASDLPTVFAVPPSQTNNGGLQMVVRTADGHASTFHFSRTDTLLQALQTLSQSGFLPEDRQVLEEQSQAAPGQPEWNIISDSQRLSDDFTMQFGALQGGDHQALQALQNEQATPQSSQRGFTKSDDFAMEAMMGRLSEDFMDLAGLEERSRKPSGTVDSQMLNVLSEHQNRVRRTSSEAVMGLLAQDSSTMGLERTSSEQLMSFLTENPDVNEI